MEYNKNNSEINDIMNNIFDNTDLNYNQKQHILNISKQNNINLQTTNNTLKECIIKKKERVNPLLK